VADVATAQPMPVDARMRLESVSKIWTAVLVLQLAEHGRLDLDDTVERWLPGVLPFGNRITLRQLLTHTSGIFDNNDAVNHPARVLARVKDPGFHADLLRIAKRLQADPRPGSHPRSGSGWPPPSRCTSCPAAATTTPTSASRSSGWSSSG
jgi:D-alanyl-D-alanine carboxypeptidase